MTKKTHPREPAQTMRNLVDTRQDRTQQTPAWPGAKEQAQPQHARSQPSSDEATPGNAEKAAPSEPGYGRSDVGRRHH